MPASFGVHGPGEITMCEGCERFDPVEVIASLRTTLTLRRARPGTGRVPVKLS
jgi:hypothetical protein